MSGETLNGERRLDGILLIDKPEGFTSFDVVARVRRLTGVRKAGHGGTLDPMATGVLPVFLGAATKACDLLPDQTKGYEAWLQLGLTSDSQDSTGKITGRKPVFSSARDVENALKNFSGSILQLPPMYSAKRVNGRRMYELAREGVEVEREPRRVFVYEIRVLDADEQNNKYKIYIHCSKGTYVRTICHDLGQMLGCGAVMTSLRRVLSAGYSVEDAVTLTQAEGLAEAGALEGRVLPLEGAFSGYPRIDLNPKGAKLFKNGASVIPGSAEKRDINGNIRVYDPQGRFLGLGFFCGGFLKVRKLFPGQGPT